MYHVTLNYSKMPLHVFSVHINKFQQLKSNQIKKNATELVVPKIVQQRPLFFGIDIFRIFPTGFN
jgi:hypothetical protein